MLTFGVPTGVLNWLQKGVGKASVPDPEDGAPRRISRRIAVPRGQGLRERPEPGVHSAPIGSIPMKRKRDRFTIHRGPKHTGHHHKVYGI